MSKKNKLLIIITIVLLSMSYFFYFIGMYYIENIIKHNITSTKNNLIKNKNKELKKDVKILYKTIESYLKENTKNHMSSKENLLKYINYIKSKELGYFWITDLNMNTIMHPNEKNSLKNILSTSSLKNIENAYDKIITTNEESVTYTMINPDNTIVNKIGYIKLFKPFGWIIGKSAELNIIDNEIISLKEQTYLDIERLAITIILILIISVLIAAYLISRITEFSFFKPIENNIYLLNKKIKNKNKKLQRKLKIDELTGLQNLYSLKYSISKTEYSTLFIIDIDSFDNINKLYGYDMGDKILTTYAHKLLSFAKIKGYKVFRLYSNTFALLDQKKEFKIEEYNKDINTLIHNNTNITINKDFLINIDLEIELDINIGICLCQDNAITKANTALSEAKKTDKRFFIYNSTLQDKTKIENLKRIREEIIKATKEDNILPFFHPIVDTEQQIVKYEVLMRLRQIKENKEEFISPHYFLDIAIKTKLYKELSKIIIEKAFEIAFSYNRNISINISLSDILDREVIELLDLYLKKDSIDRNRLITFEILENENSQDIDFLSEFVTKYRNLGVKFAIDDFGSGYSNFSNILKIKPDYIKIDGSLIKNIDIDKNSYELVKSILIFSKALGIKTIAEFIHTENIFNITKDLGVDMFQGYYFSEPLYKINDNWKNENV